MLALDTIHNLTTKEHAEGTIWNTFGSHEVFSRRVFPRWVSASQRNLLQLVTWPTKVEEQVSTNLRLSHETVWQEERVSNCEWDLFLLVLLFLV